MSESRKLIMILKHGITIRPNECACIQVIGHKGWIRRRIVQKYFACPEHVVRWTKCGGEFLTDFPALALAVGDAETARAETAEKMYADLLPVAENAVKRADALARENEALLVAWDSLVEHHETETAALNRRVGVLTEAQRAAREWLTLALNGECGISNGHEGEESCTTAQIAEVLALLTVEPEAPDA